MTRRARRAAAALLALLVLVGLATWTAWDPDAASRWSRSELLDAVRMVECGDREPAPDGDDGQAIGPYQIHFVYWLDAISFRPGLGGRYEDCRRRDYAERVVEAYMQKWVPDAWERVDAEVIARTHNGGPQGAGKDTTLRYWQKVQAARAARR